MGYRNSYSSNAMVKMSDIDLCREYEEFLSSEDFGTIDLDDCEDSDTLIYNTCSSPGDHRFEKILLLNIYHRECIFCGYSPDLDREKPELEKCHRDYEKWEKKRKKFNC